MNKTQRFSRTLTSEELGMVGGGDLVEYGILIGLIVISMLPVTSAPRTAPTAGRR